MTFKHIPRVNRAFALPVPQFDTLKHYQRMFQLCEDRAAREEGRECRTITNSEAMARILVLIELVAQTAIRTDMNVIAFVPALYMGDLKVVKVAA